MNQIREQLKRTH